MLAERDYKIAEFIREFRAVYSDHVEQVFNMSEVRANKRLRELVKEKLVKRKRDALTPKYVYFVDKPTLHKVLITELYTRLLKAGGILMQFKRSPKCSSMIPDAFFEYQLHGYRYFVFVEVQLSNGTLDTEKYEKYFESREWKKDLPAFPRVLVVGDRDFKIRSRNNLNFIVIDSGYSKFGEIFK
jgi:predicted transcriptional regulator